VGAIFRGEKKGGGKFGKSLEMQAAHKLVFLSRRSQFCFRNLFRGILGFLKIGVAFKILHPLVGGIKNSFKTCPAYTFFVSTGLTAAYFDFL